MKRLLLAALILSEFLFSAGLARSMTPGATIIRKCPHCQQLFKEFTLGSGNTFGAKFWTDFKLEAPMWPDLPWLVKCPACKKSIWIDEAKEMGRHGGFQSMSARDIGKNIQQPVWRDEWASAPEPAPASSADMLKLLATAKLTLKQELYLRHHVWWTANDPARGKTNATTRFTREQTRNLDALAKLLDEQDANQRIKKAEIFRELGNFKSCTNLLAAAFVSPGQKRTAKLIKELATQKISTVHEVKDQ